MIINGIPRLSPIIKPNLKLLFSVLLISTPLATTFEEVTEIPAIVDPDSPEDSADVAAIVDEAPPTEASPLMIVEPGLKDEKVIA
jgi:hypothetical protein